jgi:hypothetical protein
LLLLGLCLLQPAYAQTTPSKAAATSPASVEERYTSTSKHFSVPVPKGWKNLPGEKLGLRDNAFTHTQAVEGFTANIVFIEESVSGRASLNDLVKQSLGPLKTQLRDFKALEQKELKCASGDVIVRLRYQAQFLPNGVASKNTAYFVLLKDNRLLTITVSGIAATPDEHVAEAEAAILKLEVSR